MFTLCRAPLSFNPLVSSQKSLCLWWLWLWDILPPIFWYILRSKFCNGLRLWPLGFIKEETICSQKKTGIQDFFWVLSEDDVQAAQVKRKRVDSEEEEVEQAQHRKRRNRRRRSLPLDGKTIALPNKSVRKSLLQLTLRLVCVVMMESWFGWVNPLTVYFA